MPDTPPRFRTTPQQVTGDQTASWGGSKDWNQTIAEQSGVAVFNGGITPSTIPAPNDGVLAYYPLDKQSGAVTDRSGNGYSGSASSTVTRGVLGIQKSGVQFNGNGSDELLFPSVNPTSDLTASAWVKWDGTYGLNSTQIVLNSEDQYEIGITDGRDDYQDGTVTYALMTGDRWVWKDTGTTIGTSNWHHLVVVYNGTESRMYLDGSRIYTDTRSNALNTTNNPLRIGNRGISTPPFNGKIDEVGIYEHAFSDANVQRLYENTR